MATVGVKGLTNTVKVSIRNGLVLGSRITPGLGFERYGGRYGTDDSTNFTVTPGARLNDDPPRSRQHAACVTVAK